MKKIIVLYKEFKPSGKWTCDKELEVEIEDENNVNWYDICDKIKDKHIENINNGYSYVAMESKCGNYGYPQLIKK